MRALLGCLAIFLVACADDKAAVEPGPDSAGPLQVYSVNYPLAWVASQLAGSVAKVHFPAPTDIDPAYWRPDIDTLIDYQGADLILLVGAGYAQWLSRVSMPMNRMLDTSAEITDKLLSQEFDPVHSHGPEGEHSHGVKAISLWLDPQILQAQALAISRELQQLSPQAAPEIEARSAGLVAQLNSIDSELAQQFERLSGAPLLYSHPVYQYLQQRYNLNGRALHWEPDQMPTEREWADFDMLLAEHPARIMLWEAEPLLEVRERLEQYGIQIAVYQPLGNRPPQGDFASGMAANIAQLRRLTGLPKTDL